VAELPNVAIGASQLFKAGPSSFSIHPSILPTTMSDDEGDMGIANGSSDPFHHEIVENEGFKTAEDEGRKQSIKQRQRFDEDEEEEEEVAATAVFDDEEEEEDEEDLDSERPKKKSKVCSKL